MKINHVSIIGGRSEQQDANSNVAAVGHGS
jgi:hypothetical protein